MDVHHILPIIVLVILLAIFFLECLSTDIIGTVVYAVPFIIFFFIITSIFGEFDILFQELIGILVVANIIIIMGNLLKVIISS